MNDVERRIEMTMYETLLVVVLVMVPTLALFWTGRLSTPKAERVAMRRLGPRGAWATTTRGTDVLAPRFPYDRL